MNEFDKQLAGAEKKESGVGYADKVFFDRFCSQYESYGSGGDIPDNLSSELKSIFDSRKERIADRKLDCSEELMGAKLTEVHGSKGKSGKYNIKHLSKTVKRLFSVVNSAGKKYKKKENVRLCADIINAEPQEIADNEQFCCPVCGNTASLKQLEAGCETCGNSTFITGLFPRVQSFFIKKSTSLDLLDIGKMLLTSVIIGFVVGIPMIAAAMITDMPESLEGDALKDLLWGSLMMPLKFALLGAGVGIFAILGRLIFNEVKYSKKITATSERLKSLNAFMKKYDRNFSAEHFETTAIRLLQLALFSNDPNELTLFRTNSPVKDYPIIDSVYTGFMDIKSIRAEENMCIVDAEIIMSDVYDLRTRFVHQEDVFAVRLQRSLSAVTNRSLELKNTECPECKKHFDALSFSHCSFCGRQFPVWEHEWVIKELKIK